MRMNINYSDTFVKSENNLIYKLTGMTEISGQQLVLSLDFELVCGKDYINPDENDIQGYVSPNMFIEEVQGFSILWYPMTDTMEECIKEECYEVIEKLPVIHNIEL